MGTRIQPWSKDRIESLKNHFARGLTFGQIAVEMGGWGNSPDGGRNAVIGKARRLGLTRPSSTSPRSPRPPKPRPDKVITLRPKKAAAATTELHTTSNLPAAQETVETKARTLKPSPGFMSARERRERGFLRLEQPSIGKPLETFIRDPADLDAAKYLEAHFARQFG